MNETDKTPTRYCPLFDILLYLRKRTYVQIFPAPIPNRTKYGYICWNIGIIANGPAQQMPFTNFALIGQETLFFIRSRNEGNT